MTMFYEITLINADGSHKNYELHDKDEVTTVDGGLEITWHSSPSITTFYPFHRIWEYQVTDTSKAKKSQASQHVSNSTVGGSVTQIRNVVGDVKL